MELSGNTKKTKKIQKKVLTIDFGCDIIFKRSGEWSKRVDDRPPKKRMAKRFLRADTKNFKKVLKKC